MWKWIFSFALGEREPQNSVHSLPTGPACIYMCVSMYLGYGYEGGNDRRARAESAVKPAAGDRETRWAGDLGLLAVMGLHSARRADGPERNRCYNSM